MLAKEEEFIARFAARASHAAQVQSRVKKLEKIDRIEIPAEERVMTFDFPVPSPQRQRRRSDEGPLKTLSSSKTAKPNPSSAASQAWSSASTKSRSSAVNGAGKSTLLKIMAGQTDATDGHCTIGASVQDGLLQPARA